MTDRKKCSKIKVSVYSLHTNYIHMLSVQQVNHFILYIIKIWDLTKRNGWQTTMRATLQPY